MTNKSLIAAITAGGLSGLNGYLAACNIGKGICTKNIILENIIIRAPKINDEVYTNAIQAAERIVSSGDSYIGLVNAVLCTASGAAAIYYATKE